MIFTIIGALLKVIHFEIGLITGNILISIGTAIKAIAIVITIVKLIQINQKV